ncbi:MAG: pimeloyl-ACP methyl ester carboxylesterase [Saprospiraceae bacterium]|jgi:pimeloyl-ACP methyl ester carboxylesterase
MQFFFIFLLILLACIMLMTFVVYNNIKLSPQTKQLLIDKQKEPLKIAISGTTGTASNDGINISYEVQGDLEKEIILLISGHSMTMLDWPEYFISPLLQHGYTIVRLDNRDTGESDWVSDWSKENPYTLEDMAEDTMAVVNHLGLSQIHLIGMSMGGMIAQRIAINYPEKISTLTSIMSTGHYHDKKLTSVPFSFLSNLIGLQLAYASKLKFEHGKVGFYLGLNKILSGKGYNPDYNWIIDKCLYEIRNRNGYNPKASPHQSAAIKKSGSRYKQLSKIKKPTLIIHGTEDPLIKIAHGKKYASIIPVASTFFIQGMGHDLNPNFTPEITLGIIQHINLSKESNLKENL